MNRKELIRQYKETKKDRGICLLTCDFTKSEYLIATLDIEARKNRMMFELDAGVFHLTPSLEREAKHYGKAGFIFRVIEILDHKEDEKDVREELALLLDMCKEKYPKATVIF